MRVALIAPKYFPVETGNAVTVRRIERQLRLLGCELRVFPAEQLAGEKLLEGVRSFAPQLLHTFHGYHGGRMTHALSEATAIPYLITLTGTDVYQALIDQHKRETHGALRGAARLVAFHACVKRSLAEHIPSLDERTVVIPQGVELDIEPAAPVAGDTCTFLLPAGIRPVKNVLFPLPPLAALLAVYPQLRFQLVGPVIDIAYAARVMEALEAYPFASYLGGVGHDAMGALYRRADIVLNSSVAEGGMANTVLEGLAHSKALLVADIEGNRSVIREGVTGLLYRDRAEFGAKAERLITDPQLRARLGSAGRELVRDHHSPEKEARAYLELYRDILQTAAPLR